MRTEKRSAFLSGLCGVAVALGICAGSARADVTTERGASLLAFPKVLADGDSDTIIQITNISNNMVHAACFYVNAALANPNFPPGPLNPRIWQVTDFSIWLTKQQPTQWQVSQGRQVNPTDPCFPVVNGLFTPSAGCSDAGLDPGAVPPVPTNFVGELKCVEVDVAGNPIGGNHLKGEATIITQADGDAAKYAGIGIQGTDLAGETGNELLFNQPYGSEDQVGQYNACPNKLLVNHLAEGATDPVLLQNLQAGTCSMVAVIPCQTNNDCALFGAGTCNNGPRILVNDVVALRSATLTDLTLIPCTQDFENSRPSAVTVQFAVYNEFENVFSASKTIVCWDNFYLFQVDSPQDPFNSVFSVAVLGTTAAHTVVTPVDSGGGVLGVVGQTRANNVGELARTLLNIHMEGDVFSDREFIDQWTLPLR